MYIRLSTRYFIMAVHIEITEIQRLRNIIIIGPLDRLTSINFYFVTQLLPTHGDANVDCSSGLHTPHSSYCFLVWYHLSQLKVCRSSNILLRWILTGIIKNNLYIVASVGK